MIDINKIDKVFKDIGYLKKQLPNGDVQYFKNDIFCKFEYVSGLDSYILSSALGNEEAKQNMTFLKGIALAAEAGRLQDKISKIISEL